MKPNCTQYQDRNRCNWFNHDPKSCNNCAFAQKELSRENLRDILTLLDLGLIDRDDAEGLIKKLNEI